MKRRRVAYRPEVVGALEDRLVLSAVAPVDYAAFEHGPQLNPVVFATIAGSDQAKVMTQGGKPEHGQLTVSAREVTIIAGSDGRAVGLFEVDYHNESSKPITSATIEDTLGPDLEYVPVGSDVPVGGVSSKTIVRLTPNLSYFPSGSHVPPDGQVAIATGPKGSQVVELKLPGGIAPGVKGYLEFEAEERLPASTR